MFTLQKLNVVKIVSTEAKKDELISKGFTLVDNQEETEKTAVEKKSKKAQEAK